MKQVLQQLLQHRSKLYCYMPLGWGYTTKHLATPQQTEPQILVYCWMLTLGIRIGGLKKQTILWHANSPNTSMFFASN